MFDRNSFSSLSFLTNTLEISGNLFLSEIKLYTTSLAEIAMGIFTNNDMQGLINLQEIEVHKIQLMEEVQSA